jgi:hypothetical protein
MKKVPNVVLVLDLERFARVVAQANLPRNDPKASADVQRPFER